jgi:WD40 repeat protein
VVAWDLRTGQRQQLGPRRTFVYDIALAPSGETIAASYGGELFLMDVNTGQSLLGPFKASRAVSLAFSSDGQVLASGNEDGSITLWDPSTGAQIGRSFEVPGGSSLVVGIAFSPDGRILATGNADGSVSLWDSSTQDLLGSLSGGHADQVLTLAFSPDGRTLASGGGDGTIALWDIAHRRQIGESFSGYAEKINGLQFSPDGASLVSGGDAGSYYIWNQILWTQDPTALQDRLCTVAGRNLTHAEWDTFLPADPYRRTCPAFPPA